MFWSWAFKTSLFLSVSFTLYDKDHRTCIMQCTASLPAHTCSVLCILSRFYSRTSRALDSFEMLVEVRSTLAPIPVYWFASNPNQMGKGAHNKAPETSPIRDQPGTQSALCDEEGLVGGINSMDLPLRVNKSLRASFTLVQLLVRSYIRTTKRSSSGWHSAKLPV